MASIFRHRHATPVLPESTSLRVRVPRAILALQVIIRLQPRQLVLRALRVDMRLGERLCARNASLECIQPPSPPPA